MPQLWPAPLHHPLGPVDSRMEALRFPGTLLHPPIQSTTHQAQLTCRMELLRRWRSPKVKNSMGTRWPWRRPCKGRGRGGEWGYEGHECLKNTLGTRWPWRSPCLLACMEWGWGRPSIYMYRGSAGGRGCTQPPAQHLAQRLDHPSCPLPSPAPNTSTSDCALPVGG